MTTVTTTLSLAPIEFTNKQSEKDYDAYKSLAVQAGKEDNNNLSFKERLMKDIASAATVVYKLA